MKLRPDVENTEKELVTHMINPRKEHWKEVTLLIGYLKGKKTKGIIVRNPEVFKTVRFLILIMLRIGKQERVLTVYLLHLEERY